MTVTVRLKHTDSKGISRMVRVTADSIRDAVKFHPGAVVFPIDGEEFFKGSGPKGFKCMEILEEL